MSKKNVGKIILCILLILLSIAYLNNYIIVIRNAGLNNQKAKILISDIDGSNNKFVIIKTRDSNNQLVLARISRGLLGIWKVSSIKEMEEYDDSLKIAVMAWVDGIGARRFDFSQNALITYEWHFFYSGTGAKKLIEIPNEMIPNNFTISIEQSGEDFDLHIITYSDEENLGVTDFLDKIINSNYF